MSDDSESTEEGFETERMVTRAEAASVLRGLADGIDAGTVDVGEGGDVVSVAVPEEFEFEIEYEREDEVELEVEFEWPADAADETGDSVSTEGESDEGEADDGDESGDGALEGEAAGANRPPVETATVAQGETGSESSSDSTSGPGAGAGSDDGAAALTVEAGVPIESQARFELFRDRANEWRWRLVHRNGNVIADSGEGYDRKAGARNGLESVMRNAPGASVGEDE